MIDTHGTDSPADTKAKTAAEISQVFATPVTSSSVSSPLTFEAATGGEPMDASDDWTFMAVASDAMMNPCGQCVGSVRCDGLWFASIGRGIPDS